MDGPHENVAAVGVGVVVLGWPFPSPPSTREPAAPAMAVSDSLAHPGLAIVVMGVSGCGKSTVAAMLAEALGCSFIEADDYHSEANKGIRSQLVRKPSQDERGRAALRRRPRAVAGVGAGRHPGAAGRRRGRGRQLLGAAARVPGCAPRGRPRLRAGALRRLQGEVRVPEGAGGGARGEGAAEVGGRGALHAGEPAAEPARPAAGRPRGGGRRGRRDGAPRRHRPRHRRPVQGRASGVVRRPCLTCFWMRTRCSFMVSSHDAVSIHSSTIKEPPCSRFELKPVIDSCSCNLYR
uniref:gluconokinase n=1 Tax=Zea mays TaxID=4577 RepID=A0A804NQ95_MAIZE